MKKLTAIVTIIFAVAFTSNIFAQGTYNQKSVGANATAKVMAAINITKTQDLDFGLFTITNTEGTVVITPTGSRSETGGVNGSPIDEGNQANYNVTGEASATYAVTLPSNESVTLTSGSNTMVIESFSHNSDGTLSTSGTDSFSVGAILNVSANQAPGEYTGTYNVTVTYN